MRSPSFNILTSMNASCKDLFTCMYDLSHSDVNMLGILLRQKQAKTLDELATIANRDKGTAFRILQKLVSLGFCTKETMTLKEGGYYHLYSVSSIDAIERITEQRVREIQRALDLLMRKFRQDIKQMAKQPSL
jgi:predicted transcriptional regulator